MARDSVLYAELLTGDFTFRRADSDTGPWRVLRRREELVAAGALFHGAPNRAAATAIGLERVSDLLVGPDPRPGKLSPWHRWLSADYRLTIHTPGMVYHVTTRVAFFAVRGDSALIPLDLEASPDSTRWFIERWEELGPSALGPTVLPPGWTSWARIKEIYLGPPPPR